MMTALESEPSGPLVSCLCITEGRPAFMPWLLWCFDRQSWSKRELVIVDSSSQPYQPDGRTDVRVVSAPPGTAVPCKRNLALKEAQGEIVTWIDDDDWQHPEKLAVLVRALQGGSPYAGASRGWFVDLRTRGCTLYSGWKKHIIFNSAGFRREVALTIRFPETMKIASDTFWMSALARQHGRQAMFLEREELFFWLCHANNLSNPAQRRHFSKPLAHLQAIVGQEAWGDTDEALDALQQRLGTAPTTRQKSITRSRPANLAPAGKVNGLAAERPAVEHPLPAAGEQPPVGVMIKATVLDAPYLDTMVRHMIAQARYPFAERVIIVDRRASFTGKYRDRPQASQQELDRILDRLVADGVVEDVRDVDMAPARVHEILGRYFPEHIGRIPTHASTGGPIYTTLFGLETMGSDWVLQMDADVFFHSGPASWVSQALAHLQADPHLWLMMTHPGPPAGPPGRSLGRRNTQLASWDGRRNLWRFRHATTRYFLCDRRRLQQRLRPIFVAGGCAPLEQCLSQALQRHGAFRGALADLQSWHLHAWYHGDPFPQWAPRLAQLVEEGCVPVMQGGEYDLRLDLPPARRAWSTLVAQAEDGLPKADGSASAGQVEQRAASAPLMEPTVAPAMEPTMTIIPVREAKPDLETSTGLTAAADAPLAVIIPIRNRAGQRLVNALGSLHWQSAGRPAQVILVSHGSQPEIDRELQMQCAEAGVQLISAGSPAQPWNKSLALNIGIRATRPEIPYLMTMDADMILAPNFLAVALERLRREPAALVLCQSRDLPENVSLPASAEELLPAFPRLRGRAQLRPKSGTGGIQAAGRSFFVTIRGYDEDLLWWGAMDGDILNRARLFKLTIEWIENQTTLLHQWHPRKYTILNDGREIEQAKQRWLQNHELVRSRADQLYRNPHGWGDVVEPLPGRIGG